MSSLYFTHRFAHVFTSEFNVHIKTQCCEKQKLYCMNAVQSLSELSLIILLSLCTLVYVWKFFSFLKHIALMERSSPEQPSKFDTNEFFVLPHGPKLIKTYYCLCQKN